MYLFLDVIDYIYINLLMLEFCFPFIADSFIHPTIQATKLDQSIAFEKLTRKLSMEIQ